MVSGFAWEGTSKLIVQIAAWVSTIWVARLLTPEDYGLIALSGIITGLGLTISSIGLSSALVNSKNLSQQTISNSFFIGMLLAAFIYFIIYLIAPLAAQYYEQPELTKLIRVASLIIIFSGLGVAPRALIMRKLQFKYTAIINVYSSLFMTGLSLYMAFNGYGYWSLVIPSLVFEIINTSSFFVISKIRIGPPRQLWQTRSIYLFAANILISRIIKYFNGQWPVAISGQLLGTIATGYLQMAMTLAALPMSKIGDIFQSILFPVFSRIQSDRARASIVFLKIHKVLMVVTMPMFVGIAIVADELIVLMLGEKWAPIIMPVQILCVINIFSISAAIIPKVIEGMGDSKSNILFQGYIFITLPLFLYVGATYGLTKMLFSWLASMPLGYCILLYTLMKALDVNLVTYFKTLWTPLFACGAMLCANYFTEPYILSFTNSLWLILVAKVCIGVVSFIVVLIGIDYSFIRESKSMLTRNEKR